MVACLIVITALVAIYRGYAQRRRNIVYIHQPYNPRPPAQLTFGPNDSKSGNANPIYPPQAHTVRSNELGCGVRSSYFRSFNAQAFSETQRHYPPPHSQPWSHRDNHRRLHILFHLCKRIKTLPSNTTAISKWHLEGSRLMYVLTDIFIPHFCITFFYCAWNGLFSLAMFLSVADMKYNTTKVLHSKYCSRKEWLHVFC